MTIRIPSRPARMPRRVRLSRIVTEPVGRIPSPRPVALIEYPRVSSTYPGRPPVWDWRLDRAFYPAHIHAPA